MKTRTIKHVVTPLVLTVMLASLTGCNNGLEPYYKKLNTKLEGDEFKMSLHEVILHDTATNYQLMSTYHKTTDADPDNPGNILLFYTGQSVPTSRSKEGYIKYGDGDEEIQREHVWPQSRFRIYGSMDGSYGKMDNPNPAEDIYNVRPCMGYVNELRSNYFYDEQSNPSRTTLYPWDVNGEKQGTLEGTTFEFTLAEQYRGDMARIIFYMATRYEKLEIIEESDYGTGSNSYTFGRLSTLLKWNLEYNVKEYEKVRNDATQKIQGNRNPFVDHPEFACKIWGSKNAATKKVCGLE